MICGVGYAGFCPVEPAARRNISLDAYYRLNVCGDCFRIELDDAEHIAVVGNRYCVHIEFITAFEQFIERYSPIQQRILTVKMKMCKSFICHNLCHPSGL